MLVVTSLNQTRLIRPGPNSKLRCEEFVLSFPISYKDNDVEGDIQRRCESVVGQGVDRVSIV